jgi:hypothetical protein
MLYAVPRVFLRSPRDGEQAVKIFKTQERTRLDFQFV